MNNTFRLSLIILALAVTGFGQKLAKPTLVPSPLTAVQQDTLRQGTALHDEKKYDEAIAKYRSILAENPNSSAAMYELSMTLYAKGEKDKAMEIAYQGSKYIADELPLFYVTMANVLDDIGKPQEAVKIYQEGIKLLQDDKRFSVYRSSLFYNLGVTYVGQKKYAEARQALKSAIENNYAYASPHFLLSVVYNGTEYKVPGLLAASRFVSVEPNTERAGNAAAIIQDVLKPAGKDPKTGNVNVMLDFDSLTDEGDFGAVNLMLPMLGAAKDKKDKNKSSHELFIDRIDTLIALLAEDKKLPSTFVGQNYVPYMIEMKKMGFVDVFGYMVMYIAGDQSAKPWLVAHDDKLGLFMKWAAAYHLPTK